jgi:hypothetical protein
MDDNKSIQNGNNKHFSEYFSGVKHESFHRSIPLSVAHFSARSLFLFAIQSINSGTIGQNYFRGGNECQQL